MPGGEIIVVPLQTKGHIFPAIELCHRLADRGYSITLLLRSVASAGPLHPLIRILECPTSRPPEAACPPHGPGFDFEAGCISPFRELLARRADDLVCAVVDVMMSHLITVCRELGIPAVSFFTSSACSAALDRAASKLSSSSSSSDDEDLGHGRILPLTIPGLPEDMALTISDLKHRDGPPPPGFGPGQHGGRGGPRPPPFGAAPPPFRPATFRPEHSSAAPPTEPGPFLDGAPPPGPPEGLTQTDGAIALLFNTCDDLERPFIDYVAKEAGKPVWGVGPLLPASFWSRSRSLVRDEVARPTDRESSVSEKEVLEWLDSKPRGSVIYVSFGSLVGPSNAELAELAAGLEESGRPFIWALQPGAMPHDPSGRIIPAAGPAYFPVELARVAEGEGEEGPGRGLLIRGWAPQLLILSHPSTGGFLTHCGWNSTVEAIGCGMPMLTWPIHGDQMHNAKLVTRRLKIGHRITINGADDGGVRKDDVVLGIERLMSDAETRQRAASMRSTFVDRFPQTSSASLDAFLQFLNKSSH